RRRRREVLGRVLQVMAGRQGHPGHVGLAAGQRGQSEAEADRTQRLPPVFRFHGPVSPSPCRAGVSPPPPCFPRLLSAIGLEKFSGFADWFGHNRTQVARHFTFTSRQPSAPRGGRGGPEVRTPARFRRQRVSTAWRSDGDRPAPRLPFVLCWS